MLPADSPYSYPVSSPSTLRSGALSLASSVVIGVASAGPAYSITATLGLVAAAVGLHAPVIVLVAFVPMLLVALGYRELNRVEPDPGTTFVWATRAFGPFTGWMSGWAIVVSDLLVMASLAQISAQYTFLLLGAHGIGSNPTSGWVLLLGIAYLVVMTLVAVCGIDVSARLQSALLAVEFGMLTVFSLIALGRVLTGHGPPGSSLPHLSWFDPFAIGSFSDFVTAVLLMVFIYWGWDSAVSVNQETVDPRHTPGRSAVLSTITLVALYLLVTVAGQAFAGAGTEGLGLANPEHVDDVLGALGGAVFGSGPVGTVLVHLLFLMVLTSAAASTQTTILPTARTTYSMALHHALPKSFGRIDPRWLTPSFSTMVFGGLSIALYVALNFVSGGRLIAEAVTAIGISIGLYYGLTGLSCAWLYRHEFASDARAFVIKRVLPALGGLALLFAAGWTAVTSWTPKPGDPAWQLPIPPHWRIGGTFLLGVGTLLIGVPLYLALARVMPRFFRGQVLARRLPSPTEAVVSEDALSRR
ncbi:APC family permease [Nocardia terpenica]|nr:APC family permease [Nocardia terpenica]MBF6102822.1 APC family permease [Nocardia terpenica]MBF6110987.1 APC family permease [Nocardia terpenica]MBF6117118.1 APC family permease [Nocardia terpenica]MBF6151042.1 APC family permease [Nocardia terpenica]